MALKPLYNITIETAEGDLIIDRVHDLEVTEDWQNLSNVGYIKIPRKAVIASTKKSVLDIIKTSQKVVVKLGYMASNIPVNQRWVTEFIGYVSQMPQPFAPAEILLENEAFVLKRKPIAAKTFTGHTKLVDVLKYIIGEGYTIDCVDMELSESFTTKTGSAAQALQLITDKYGIKFFFRLIPDTTLPEGAKQVFVAGKPYNSADLLALTPADDVVFGYGRNVIESNLKFVNKNDARIKVRATNKLKRGKDYSIEVGDDDGTVVQKTYNDLPASTLRKLAESELQRLKVDKFTGDFTSLGFPFVRVGRIVNYEDWRFKTPANTNRYFTDKVKVKSGVGGYRRIITLGWLTNSTNTGRLI